MNFEVSGKRLATARIERIAPAKRETAEMRSSLRAVRASVATTTASRAASSAFTDRSKVVLAARGARSPELVPDAEMRDCSVVGAMSVSSCCCYLRRFLPPIDLRFFLDEDSTFFRKGRCFSCTILCFLLLILSHTAL